MHHLVDNIHRILKMQPIHNLQDAIKAGATDIHFLNEKVFFRVARKLVATNLLPSAVRQQMDQLTQVEQKSQDHSRIHCNEHSLSSLKYPLQIRALNQYSKGLILVTGIAGSGKTTFLTHLLSYFPNKRVFLENLFFPGTSSTTVLVSPYSSGQDVTLMNIQTEEQAFNALQRSKDHLVIAQLNSDGATDSLRHLLLLLRNYDQKLILHLLADQIQIIFQTTLLLNKKNEILPLIGILQSNESVSNQIRENRITSLHDLINKGNAGADTLGIDLQLAKLVQEHKIDLSEALNAAIKPSSMQLRANGILHNE